MREAREHPWYHTIDLPDGSSTPGVFDTRAVAELVRWPAGLPGGRCLDVGTCDGFWAFEMERRGAAEVIAIDVDDLDPSVHGRFDVVFCGTLLVHLRDPVRALERMREVCTGELVLVECVDA